MLRRQPNLKGLVVIIFSSGSQPSDLERAYELGANSFLEKPSGVELTIEIARLLKAWGLDLNCFAKIEDAPPERISKAA
jgi:CheY-like chemotaxis protein